jgi:hypothetical protein
MRIVTGGACAGRSPSNTRCCPASCCLGSEYRSGGAMPSNCLGIHASLDLARTTVHLSQPPLIKQPIERSGQTRVRLHVGTTTAMMISRELARMPLSASNRRLARIGKS